jgi:large subunit ribosomal protein L5
MKIQLQEKYNKEVKPILQKEFEKNKMLCAKLDKITISVGTGEAGRDTKLMQNITNTISLIAGQKAVMIKSKKSIAGFKVREGAYVGIKVTLRGKNMFTFLDKLCSVALPRVKDFRGINRNGFDGSGNFSFGLQEQLMFPEIEYDDIIKIHGMNISISTTAINDKESFRLLELMGIPFSKGAA